MKTHAADARTRERAVSRHFPPHPARDLPGQMELFPDFRPETAPANPPAGRGGPRAAAGADMVRVAPGVHGWMPAPGREVPAYVLCRWARATEGCWRPVPVGGRYARVGRELLALLGFNTGRDSSRYETLYRLGRAGFVDMVKVSPGCWLLDLDSWFRHLSACMDDPDMWEEGSEARTRYEFANGLGRKRA